MGSKLEGMVLQYAGWIIRFRWLVVVATIVAVLGIASGMRHLEFSTNYRVFFSDENPEMTAFETFQNIYTKNDNIVFVVKPKTGKVFTPEVIEAIEKITARAWSIPYTIRVDSITNFQHSWADGDDLTVEDLIRGGGGLSQAELDRRQAIALAEPLLRNNLISADAATTGINVTLQMPQVDFREVPEAVAVARGIATDIRAEYPELKIALSGLSMLNNAFAEAGEKDITTLVPIMYGVLLLFMILMLRSFSATFSTLLVIGFSSVAAMGLAGFAGIKLTPISVTAPTIILTLAIADSIHILVTMLTLMREGHDKTYAIKESMRINFLPVSITSLTTIVGFLSLNFSDSPPFWHLGNITAAGIAVAWALSLAFLPAILALLPVRCKARTASKYSMQKLLGRFADFVLIRRRSILVIMGAASLALFALIPTIELNDQWVEYFDERIEFRNDSEFAIANLNGPYIIEYSMEAIEAGGISNPEYLENLETFTAWLRTQPEVAHVFSYTDIIKRLNKNLNGDDPEFYRIPDERQLAAQYLLLYELSLPYGLDLNNRINIDKSATRVSATLVNVSTAELRTFVDRSQAYVASHLPPYMVGKATSASVMFSYISQRNIEGMLKGNVVAVIVIAGIMILALRSFAIGAMSIIPNAVPILMAFGVWALLVGQIGMAASVVAATSLGIVVDDTVHFLTKYLRGRREKGLNRPDAIRYAFETVGQAIILTTIILTFGFAVLATSTFLINAQMGLLTALTIVIALAVDFLMLPAILMIGYKTEETQGAPHESLVTQTS
ncbi:MAG: MMPL family transporter [Proteobacteria bacterium]|nr:MMPL family transporter [Pseudomonadota bacterium]